MSRLSDGTTIFGSALAALTIIAVMFAPLIAFFTHIYWVVTGLMNDSIDTTGEIALAVAGLLFPPFGVVHGFILWFI